jgi:hypothetical protein
MALFSFLLSILFAFISTLFGYYGIKHALDCRRMFQTGIFTEGTVTDIRAEQRRRKGRIHAVLTPVITFETVWREKREITCADPLGANIFKVGDKVKIWYDENDPAIFTLGGWYLVKDLISFLIFALCFGLPGWTLLIHYIYLFF